MVNFERCTLCQSINFSDIYVEGLTLRLAPYLLVWQQGSHSRPQCGLCALLQRCLHDLSQVWDVLLFRYNNHYEAIVVIATTTAFAKSSAYLDLLCGPSGTRWSYDPKAEFSCAFLSINEGIGNFKGYFTSRRLLSSDPGSKACLDIAKRWLTECSKQPEPRTHFVPSRLIDLRLGSEDDAAVLVSLPQGNGGSTVDRIKYAALSYCWGADRFLTTTSLNIDAARQSILIGQLPQTIQDAIKIVRHLGVRYLWVDSLCIIQGTDAEAQRDWLSESEKMGQIYQSACFTISAESASTAVDGFLNERPKPLVDVCAIPKSLGAPAMIYLTEYQPTDSSVIEPLHLRGWTLQETIMSRRLLKFGTKEMSWRCPHGTQREGCGEEQSASPCDTHSDIHVLEEFSEQARSIYKDWQTIIEDYSKRKITVDSDKLHAIAGLAKLAQRKTKDIYVTGVWTRGAPMNLLWIHSRKKAEFIRKEVFQAPTWSWASVDGSIQFLRNYEQLDDIVIEWQPSNNNVALDIHKRLDLSITGRIVQLSTIRCQVFGTYHGGYDRYLPWTCLSESLKTYIDDTNEICNSHKKGGEDDPLELINSWFLLLATAPSITGDNSLGAGLVLLPARSGSKLFRRVGMFEGFPLDEFEALERKPLFRWKKKLLVQTVRLI